MIKVENIDAYGFEHAVRAMRNPMNSWDKSDSGYDVANICDSTFYIGDADMDLMQRLYNAGTEHRTYARMIHVWMDITAPLYWWKEMDRYGIGKSQVSTSTMHKIHAKEFALDDFSVEHLSDNDVNSYIYREEFTDVINSSPMWHMDYTIAMLNTYRDRFLETKDKLDWWQLIQLLPSSYNQKRTVCMSYETVFKIIKERTGHKLDEWNQFVDVLKSLPYIKEIIGESE